MSSRKIVMKLDKIINESAEQNFHKFMSEEADEDIQILWNRYIDSDCKPRVVPADITRRAIMKLFTNGFIKGLLWGSSNMDGYWGGTSNMDGYWGGK